MNTILVIEDEQNIRETLVDILSLSGYEVFSACNGKEGYDKILQEKPDLVLCDVNMPELDGFALLEAITNRLSNQVMPAFLFLTARVETKEIRHGMNLGADDYILKPFEHTEVLKVIKLRLEKREKMLGAKSDKSATSSQQYTKLSIPTEEGLELVPFNDILMCKAERAYCTFFLNKGRKLLVSKPMGEFEEILIAKGFFKVHKSTIVNIDFADKYVRGKGGYLVLSDGSQVVVSTRKKEELMKILKYK
jgi:two-component system LytT family response regulator